MNSGRAALGCSAEQNSSIISPICPYYPRFFPKLRDCCDGAGRTGDSGIPGKLRTPEGVGFNGGRPVHYGDGLAAHLSRMTGREYLMTSSGEVERKAKISAACFNHEDSNVRPAHKTFSAVLAARFTTNAARVRELAAPLTKAQFWQKAYLYGNSFGHLVLHLTGNLNYYIGAQIAKTGYIRDRPREFNDPHPPSKEEVLKPFDDAVATVQRTIGVQASDDWSAAYSATGTDANTRLDIVLVCAAHMQHHIGQMIYLGYEWQRQASATA